MSRERNSCSAWAKSSSARGKLLVGPGITLRQDWGGEHLVNAGEHLVNAGELLFNRRELFMSTGDFIVGTGKLYSKWRTS